MGIAIILHKDGKQYAKSYPSEAVAQWANTGNKIERWITRKEIDDGTSCSNYL